MKISAHESNLWISRNLKGKLLWKQQTGKAIASYSAMRWWSKWEIFKQIMLQFGEAFHLFRSHWNLQSVKQSQKACQIFTSLITAWWCYDQEIIQVVQNVLDSFKSSSPFQGIHNCCKDPGCWSQTKWQNPIYIQVILPLHTQ